MWIFHDKENYLYSPNNNPITKVFNDIKKVPDIISNIKLYPFSKQAFVDKNKDDSDNFQKTDSIEKSNDIIAPYQNINNNQLTEQLSIDSSTYFDDLENFDNTISIKKDIMLLSKTIKIIGFNKNKTEKNKILDSLLTGEESNNKIYSDNIIVELWQTPLNTKGYKFSRNKLIIYGFKTIDDIELILFNSNYYIKLNNNIYRIIFTDDFQPLDNNNIIKDKDLLIKLKTI
jgi:hypothetical protein